MRGGGIVASGGVLGGLIVANEELIPLRRLLTFTQSTRKEYYSQVRGKGLMALGDKWQMYKDKTRVSVRSSWNSPVVALRKLN